MQELEAEQGIPKTTVSKILTSDLGLKCVMAKVVLWFLLLEQKEHCAAVANDLIQTTTNEPDFLKKIITRDECGSMVMIWKQRPSHPNGSHLVLHTQGRHAKVTASKMKTMLTVFFDWEGVVHHEYTPPGQTVNKEYYTSMFFIG